MNDWVISGPTSPTKASPGGWAVTVSGNSLMVTVPATAPLGEYTVDYGIKYLSTTGSASLGTDQQYYSVTSGAFRLVTPPPTKPAAGNPAFGWQGSVGGVNTGNGNKTTTVPLVSWTQRGGMAVSCALYHNSQGSIYGPWGSKWVPSYFTYLSPGPGTGVTLHWDNGLTYSFTNSNGTYTPPYGILDTLTSSGNGTFTLTTPSKVVYTFGFAPGSSAYYNAYLSRITDLDGNSLTINHNSNTTISSLVDATGRTLTYAYDGNGHLASVTEPLGRTWGFTYGAAGGTGTNNLWYMTLPAVNGSSYALWFGYDAASNIVAMQTPAGHTNGYTATFGYNADSSLAWSQDVVGNRTTFTYGVATTTASDPNGHTLTHTYAASRLASVTDAQGKTESYSYDYNNILSTKTDKRGNSWGFSSHFDIGNNNVSTSTDALGNSSSVTYDPTKANKAVSSTDALGNTTASTYSADNHYDLLTTKVTGTGASPFTATSTIGGYSNGLPTTFTDALGYPSSIAYDASGNVTSAQDANHNTASATFNALGWKMTSTDGLNHTTTYTYDNWGRVTAVTAPDSTQTTTTYDPNGNVLTVTDANSHTVTNVYDADDRLIQTTNGRGDVVTYTYDGPTGYGSLDRNGLTQKGLLSVKTDGNGHTTTYTYTARNEPYQTFYADGTGESVTYDASGNTLSRTKPDGKVIGYAYDKDNRLTDITYPTLHATHFGYDADGRRTLMTDATGQTTWGYADGLHLSVLISPVGGVSYWYDADGRRTAMEGFVNGVGDVSYWYYGYDAGGRLSSLRSTVDGTTTFAYDGADRLTQKTKGNGEYETYGYDVADQLTGLGFWWSDGTGRNSQTYTYDAGGRVTGCDQGWYKTSYGYDGADQLTSETSVNGYPPPALGYTYDHNGNRLTQTQNGQPYQSFTYDAHDKLTSGTAGNEVPGYDPNGSETSLSFYGEPTFSPTTTRIA